MRYVSRKLSQKAAIFPGGTLFQSTVEEDCKGAELDLVDPRGLIDSEGGEEGDASW